MTTRYGISNIERVSKACFFAGLGFVFLCVCCGVALHILGIDLLERIEPCVIYTRSGYYCPGCGGTRAIIALCRGEFLLSLCYHPAVLYFAACFFVFALSHTFAGAVRFVSPAYANAHKLRGLYFCPYVFYVGIGIILVQCLVKNILVYFAGFSLANLPAILG